MLTAKRKLFLLSAFMTLMSLGWAGCRGFFVKPTLTSIAVTPSSVNLQVGGTQSMTATGTNDDGSHSNLTGSSTWTSSNPSQVTVSSSGLATAIANTSSGVSITATNTGISGTATVTVGQTQTLTINSSLGTTIHLSTDPAGTAITFTATLNGSDVTSATTFTTSNSSIISLSTTNTSQGTIGGSTGTVTISGTDGTATGSVQITVQQ